MNLNFIKTIGSKAYLGLKKISPELAMVGGIVTGIGCVVTACIATRHLDEVTDELHEELDSIQEAIESNDMDAQDIKNAKIDTVRCYANYIWRLIKLYGPSATLGLLSLYLTNHGFGEMKGRYLDAAAAYKALDTAFKDYRKRVANDLGLGEGEKAFAAAAKSEKQEDGSKGLTIDPKHTKSCYEFDFNRHTAPLTWDPDPTRNDMLLRAEQNYFNDLFRVRHHVFLNEVLDRLGLERTAAGQLIGWYWGAGDNFIDFGYLDTFIRDWNTDTDLCKKNIHLNFNCDGIIYDLLPDRN